MQGIRYTYRIFPKGYNTLDNFVDKNGFGPLKSMTNYLQSFEDNRTSVYITAKITMGNEYNFVSMRPVDLYE